MKSMAVVTGASSGIGRALAEELAARGFDLALVARDESRLGILADELKTRHGTRSVLIPCDLSLPASCDHVAARLEGENVEILVNNAGFGLHGEFARTDLQAELTMVELQIGALLRLTKAFLPRMLENRRGRILNVSSVYAFAPVPQQLVYGACKTFLYSFSESLSSETKGRGVTVTLLCPGVTRTEFRSRAGIRPKRPNAGNSAEEVARLGADACLRGKFLVIPGFWHRVFAVLMRHLPVRFRPGIVHFINVRRGVNK